MIFDRINYQTPTSSGLQHSFMAPPSIRKRLRSPVWIESQQSVNAGAHISSADVKIRHAFRLQDFDGFHDADIAKVSIDELGSLMPHLARAWSVETVVITILNTRAEAVGAIRGMTTGRMELCEADAHLKGVVDRIWMMDVTAGVLLVQIGCVVVQLMDGKYIELVVNLIVE